MLKWNVWPVAVRLGVAAVVAAVVVVPVQALRAQDAPEPAAAGERFVAVGPDGGAVARVLLQGDACPDLIVDGAPLPMQLRAGPGLAPVRAQQERAANFPVRACEAPIPSGAHSVRLGSEELPLPRARPQRIVIIGDTGCRMKASENLFQDCSDAQAWPFPALAVAAAAERPDLVVHVGDYHYRESPCAAGAACGGSPWGYGWDAWSADFFAPARPLLRAAPWVFVRGNHEECARAGQGWFRFLAAEPFASPRSCDRAADDREADTAAPYVVPLGGNWQLLVFDSSHASRPLKADAPADAWFLARYREQMQRVAQLAAQPGMHTIFISHHPVLGLSPGKGAVPRLGFAALLDPLQDLNGARVFPPGITAALHGHVHAFEAISFASPHPPTLVAGDGGDLLDRALPQVLPAHFDNAPAVRIDFVAHAKRFAYLVVDRQGEGWSLRARTLEGADLAQCTLSAQGLQCAQAAAFSRPEAAPEEAPPPSHSH